MDKKGLVYTILSLSVCLCSCQNIDSNEYIEEYTVIWQNDNGDILEIERHIKEGDVPIFSGATPIKESTNQYSYTFAKWEPEIGKIYENTTYTATYYSTINKYTITWKDDDGSVLKVDNDISYGTMPKYDLDIKIKEENGIRYVFDRWEPEISYVKENTSYVAKYIKEADLKLIAGVNPILLEDNKFVQYGFYPQSHVNDVTLIEKLNTLEKSSVNNWYLYDENYYLKEKANIYNNEDYTFDDGEKIINDNEYWFKCEPITWQVLNNNGNEYELLSLKLLDTCVFFDNYDNRTIYDQIVYANNYEYSNIRNWLNNDFYNTSFALNNKNVLETFINNEANTTDNINNKYTCNNTKDKVYLLSYQDYLNTSYGFESNNDKTSEARACKTTDYARAKGAFYSKNTSLKYNGTYWTRSPSSDFYYSAYNINSGGYLSNYAIDGNSHCIRPAITIDITYKK